MYCSVCGTPEASRPPSPTRRISLDLSPRTRGAAKTTKAESVPSSPTHEAWPHTHPGRPAAALHQRAKTSALLDLRSTHTPAPAKPHVEHSANHVPAPAPATTVHERHASHLTSRLEQAKAIEKSPHIKKFEGHRGGRLDTVPPATPTPAAQPAPAHHARATAPAQAASVAEAANRQLPPHVVTQHQALSQMAAAAPPPSSTAHHKPARSGTWRPRLDLTPHTSRVLATSTAVVVMAGYIWLQNYPKFALQSAAGKAGIQASLPGYLPSSYSLAHTDTAPGLITLNFTSPSASDKLVIAQHRTSWDSSSLLDNYVAKNADSYATVQGQGLTIYVFNNNNATWVNRGVWYSIEGASRLSREQILKIAYSL